MDRGGTSELPPSLLLAIDDSDVISSLLCCWRPPPETCLVFDLLRSPSLPGDDDDDDGLWSPLFELNGGGLGTSSCGRKTDGISPISSSATCKLILVMEVGEGEFNIGADDATLV